MIKLLILYVFLLIPTNILASNLDTSKDSVTEAVLPVSENGISIEGALPEFNKDLPYASLVEDKINYFFNYSTNYAVKNRIKNINFDYETYENRNYLNVVLYFKANTPTSFTKVFSINIDKSNNKEFTIEDFFQIHENSTSLILEELLNTHKENAYFDFLQDQSFYTTSNTAYLLFDSYSINTNNEDVTKIPFKKSDFHNVILEKGSYYTVGAFKSKVAPISLLEDFGYSVSIDDDIYIINSDELSLSINKNNPSYFNIESDNPSDSLLLPLSFFKNQFGIEHFIDNQENIILSSLSQ